MENINLGMRISELLKMRPGLKSGTNLMDIFEDNLLLWNDLNNPKKIDLNTIDTEKWRHSYRFKEKAELPLLETVYYYFISGPQLQSIRIEGELITGKEIDALPQNRDKLLLHVLELWGKPDYVYGAEYLNSRTKAHEHYMLEFVWLAGDVYIDLKCPVVVHDYAKTVPLLTRVWGRILGVGMPVRISISNESRVYNPQRPQYDYGWSKSVTTKETEVLLESIGYHKLLEQSLRARADLLKKI